ncbi:MAG: hypothetical protein R3F19_07715 [Verrucomicrobiales bacterium]
MRGRADPGSDDQHPGQRGGDPGNPGGARIFADQIEEVFAEFQGDFDQTPPMVSAIKKDGVPLYKLARQGKEVKRDPRPVHIYEYKIDRVNLPEIEFTVLCSKGFYVRTYAHDIGEKLGCGAHLSALRRTRSGNLMFRWPSHGRL